MESPTFALNICFENFSAVVWFECLKPWTRPASSSSQTCFSFRGEHVFTFVHVSEKRQRGSSSWRKPECLLLTGCSESSAGVEFQLMCLWMTARGRQIEWSSMCPLTDTNVSDRMRFPPESSKLKLFTKIKLVTKLCEEIKRLIKMNQV